MKPDKTQVLSLVQVVLLVMSWVMICWISFGTVKAAEGLLTLLRTVPATAVTRKRYCDPVVRPVTASWVSLDVPAATQVSLVPWARSTSYVLAPVTAFQVTRAEVGVSAKTSTPVGAFRVGAGGSTMSSLPQAARPRPARREAARSERLMMVSTWGREESCRLVPASCVRTCR